jgi:hypothetical protein
MVRRQDRSKQRRFYASVPIEFQVQAPKSAQSYISLGVLRNISYGGPTSLLIIFPSWKKAKCKNLASYHLKVSLVPPSFLDGFEWCASPPRHPGPQVIGA